MISIHAPRVGSDLLRYQLYAISTISIHAPRVGSDCNVGPELHRYSNFNPRSPCGERPVQVPVDLSGSLFQSTLPVWGATRDALILGTDLSISIHAPRVGSDRSQRLFFIHCRISIHAPRVGSDPTFDINRTVFPAFQSTLPVWGATSPLESVLP